MRPGGVCDTLTHKLHAAPGAHNPCNQPLPSVYECVPSPPRFLKLGLSANNGLVVHATHPSCSREGVKKFTCAVPSHQHPSPLFLSYSVLFFSRTFLPSSCLSPPLPLSPPLFSFLSLSLSLSLFPRSIATTRGGHYGAGSSPESGGANDTSLLSSIFGDNTHDMTAATTSIQVHLA